MDSVSKIYCYINGLSNSKKIISGLIVGSSLIYLAYRFNEKRFKFNAYTTSYEASDGVNLSNKYAIITGCTSGIGMQTAKELIRNGCTVLMANRNVKKSEMVKEQILNTLNHKIDGNALVILSACDLSSLYSVQIFAQNVLEYLKEKNVSKIDYLINNAGSSKIECFKINHLGHFYLTQLLIPKVLHNKSRVINVTSFGYVFAKYEKVNNMLDYAIKYRCDPAKDERNNTGSLTMYEQTKLYQILFTKELHKRYNTKYNIISCVLHPGLIMTPIITENNPSALRDRLVLYWFKKSISQGAATTIRLVCLNDDEIHSGHYYMDCCDAEHKLSGIFKTHKNHIQSLQAKVWDLSQLMVGRTDSPQ